MANSTFSGPVRSENGFKDITKNSTTGAITGTMTLSNYETTADGATTGKEAAIGILKLYLWVCWSLLPQPPLTPSALTTLAPMQTLTALSMVSLPLLTLQASRVFSPAMAFSMSGGTTTASTETADEVDCAWRSVATQLLSSSFWHLYHFRRIIN